MKQKKNTRAELFSVGKVGAVVAPRKHLTSGKFDGRYMIGIGKVPLRNRLSGIPKVKVVDGLWFSEKSLKDFVELSYHVSAYVAMQAIENEDDQLKEEMVPFLKDFHRRKWWQYPLFVTAKSGICCGCAARMERERQGEGNSPKLVHNNWTMCMDPVEVILG